MKLLVLKGDGIGPEIVAVALTVTESLNRQLHLGLEFEEGDFGLASIERYGDPLLSVPKI